MVLEKLHSGAPRHVLDLDDGSRKLAFILCLPLVDGVFATLLVTGAVNTFSQMINVAITIFTGAGALAVLYSESDSKEDAIRMINNVLPILLLGTLMVALIAPFFEQMFNTGLLKYAAGLAILSIAGQIAGLEIAENLPPNAVIITGLLLSYQGLGTASFTLSYVPPAIFTALIAISGLYAATALKKYEMDLKYVRYGGAVVLAIISLSLFGYEVPDNLGPAIFALSIIISLRMSEQ